MQMLIIGEDPHVRQLLKAEGIAAVADETGLQALDLLETAPYSLVVVCDGSLPGADALSFIRRIRRDFPRARVFILVVTDAEAREKRAAFLSAGTDDFLYKPFSGMELSDKLRLGARIAALESKTAGSPEVAAGPVDISGLLMRLLPGVVHEINNPTGFVSGNLSTMEGYVKDIAEQFHRLMDLRAVLSCRSDLSPGEKKLLDVCKSHADRIDLEFVLSDITALLNESREGMTRIQALTHALREAALPDDKVKDAPETWRTDVHQCLETAFTVIWNELKYTITVHRRYGELPLIACPPRSLGRAFLAVLAHAIEAIDGAGEMGIQTSVENGVALVCFQCAGRGVPLEKRRVSPGPETANALFQRCEGRLDILQGPAGDVQYKIRLAIPTEADEKDK